MATTKYMLAEQVMSLLKGGAPSAPSNIKMPAIIKLLEQLINANLKINHFNTQMAAGETIPEGTVLAMYDRIPVEPYKRNFSRAKLPAIPVSLPRDMGIYFVGPHVPNQQLESNIISTAKVSSTQINIGWTVIENATSYYLERATNAAFTENVTPLYTGALLVFSDTNLTPATNYWYRVLGRAALYNDSIFSISTSTT